MVSIADAYRIVIPSVARVESRTAYRLATPPDELARAAFTPVERAIIETIAKRAATTRRLEKIGPPGEVRATIARFVADGILERRDAATGRHRDTADSIARLAGCASIEGVRGSKQREVLSAIANAGATGVRIADLKAEIDGASAALKSLVAPRLDRDRGGARRGNPQCRGGRVRSHRRTASRAGCDFTGHRASALRSVFALGCHRQRQDRNLSASLPRARSRPGETF